MGIHIQTGDTASGNLSGSYPNNLVVGKLDQLIPGAKFGTETNYIELETDGTLRKYGNATEYDDIVFEMTPARLGALSKPDWDTTNLGFLFPQNDTTEYVDIIVQLSHRWKEGSTIYPHVHVRQAANTQAVFKMDYRWYNLGQAIPEATQTYTMNQYAVTYSSGTISQIVKGAGISGTGKTISSLLKLRLYRDDNAYTGDILVDQFDVHIEIDGLGSRQEYSK